MTKLFVGNLSFEVTQGDLRAAFAVYGPVSSANVVMDRSNGGSRGFGFIEMPWLAHAMAAIQGLDGTDLKGRSINVSRARPRSGGWRSGECATRLGRRRRRTQSLVVNRGSRGGGIGVMLLHYEKRERLVDGG